MLQKIHQVKAKDSEIKIYLLGLGNISGDFSANKMKKPGLIGCMYDFLIDYRTFDAGKIIDIHKYLMEKHNIK